jgi:3-hydroxyisobutyrate dehydrogenase-like beta-hydroxyacid dehydrogenase
MATDVGWLGTGRMGAALAGRLLEAGERVTVWNRTPGKTLSLAAAGARVAERIGDLGSCDVVFVTVSASRDLEEVVAALLAGSSSLSPSSSSSLSRPGIIVDCSTVSAAASARVRAMADEAGTGFLAAPVSGNPHMVAEGAACIVASGPVSVFVAARPFLDLMARVVVHVGPAEQARLVKLCHNLYLGMMVQALAEVTSLAEKGGTDRAAFLEFLNGTVLASDWVRRRTPDLVARDWTPTFTTELLRKDFDLGLEAARSLEVPLPVAAAVHQLIQSAIGIGLRHADFLSLYDQQALVAGLGPASSEGDLCRCRNSCRRRGSRSTGRRSRTSTPWNAGTTACCWWPRIPWAVRFSSACRTTGRWGRCSRRSARTPRMRC